MSVQTQDTAPALRTAENTATAGSSYAGAQQNPPLRYSVEGDGPVFQHSGSQQSGAQPSGRQPRYSAGIMPRGVAPPPQPPHYSVEAAPRATAPVATAEPEQAEQVTVTSRRPGYRLGAGDKVHVTVFGETDLTGDFEVSGNGHIAFPLIGDVTAAGLTAPGLGRKLSRRLSAGYLLNPRVAVEVSAYRPFYVVGQVHKPGGYPYTNGMTVMNAIALAGGFTPYAYEGSVYIRHEDQAKEVERRADASTIIKPGDVVRVSESGFWSVMDVLTPVTRVVGAARYGFP